MAILLFFILGILLVLPINAFAFIPVICDLCTIGVVAGLAVSRYLGVDDSVVGVWIGATLVVLITMTNRYLEKKNIHFRWRDSSITLSFVIFTLVSFYYAKVIGLPRNTFFQIHSIFADKILISSLIGGIMLVVSSSLYQWLKAKNNGKAHFPFEKVAIPMIGLALTSALFYFITQA